MYLAPEEGAALVRCLGRLLRCAVFVVYEQIRPYDPFGQQMVLNLQACPVAPFLSSFDGCSRQQSQLDGVCLPFVVMANLTTWQWLAAH